MLLSCLLFQTSVQGHILCMVQILRTTYLMYLPSDYFSKLVHYCLLFTVRLLIFESLMLFTSVALFPVLSVSVDIYPLVSSSPPAFASGVDPLPFVIVADHPITDSERMIPGLFLPLRVKIIEFDDRFSYLFI